MILWQRNGVAHRTINYPCFDDRCVQERYSRISVPFTEYAVDIPNQERRRARLGGNPGRIVRTEIWCEMKSWRWTALPLSDGRIVVLALNRNPWVDGFTAADFKSPNSFGVRIAP